MFDPESDNLNLYDQSQTGLIIEPPNTDAADDRDYDLYAAYQDTPSTPQSAHDSPNTAEALPRVQLNGRVRSRDLCVAIRQLATLLQAGMPLAPALDALADQFQNSDLGRVIADLHQRINAGQSLAQGMRQYPEVFGPLFPDMVHAAEASGALEQILLNLADMTEKRNRLAGKITAALAYPLLMALVAVAIVGFLIAFVIPQLTAIFIEMNHNLPWPTQLLIATSDFARRYLFVGLLAITLALAALLIYAKSSTGRLNCDRLKLRLPGIGSFLLKIETARLTRTLAVLLNSGLNILDALALARNTIQNRFLAQKINDAASDIARGLPIAQALQHTDLFDPIVYHTVATGEMSGNLEQQLLNLADNYQWEIETKARTLTTLLEPAIMLFMGAVVGFIVLALLLPIFEINQMF